MKLTKEFILENGFQESFKSEDLMKFIKTFI